jgi:hypothetical protein
MSKGLATFKKALQTHPVSKAFIAELVEAAYERGWHDQMYSHGRSQRPPTDIMDIVKSDTERAIDAGITERDYLARIHSKEQGLKS